ncbi:unnamed protein product, partial [Protopolystoma xenopodis]
GDNQRLEFLGDSLLKFASTDYLFRHFPRHHEGHLSLLKNSLVNKYTQAAVCTELGLDHYIVRREDNASTRPPVATTVSRKSPGPQSVSIPLTHESEAMPAVTPIPYELASSKMEHATKPAPSAAQQNQNVKFRADLLEG